MPSRHARELLDELRAGVGERIECSGRARGVHEQAMAAYPAPQSAALERTTAGGVEALRVTAAGAAERVGVLYLHGGGFAVGSARSDQDLLARLGHAAGAAALAIDYGLLPENPFPGPLEDAFAAYRELAAEGPLVLAGSSAGAGLAVAVALRMREGTARHPPGSCACRPGWT